MIYKITLTSLFFFFFLSTQAQNDSLADNEIMIIRFENNKIGQKTHGIRPWHKTKIWLYDEKKPLKDSMVYCNDSTITISGRNIPIKNIQKIHSGSRFVNEVGGLFVVSGVLIASLGAVSLQLILEGGVDLDELFYVVIYGGVTVVGSLACIVGLGVLAINNRKFDMNKWHLIFEKTEVKVKFIPLFPLKK